MAYRFHIIKALIRVDRAAAREAVKVAYIDARCSVRAASRTIGCGRRCFLLWARELGLEPWMAVTKQIAKRDGWHHENVGGAATHRDPSRAFASKRAKTTNRQSSSEAIPTSSSNPNTGRDADETSG